MEIVAAIGAGLTLARIIVQSVRRRGRRPITLDEHSPPELDKLVGSVSRKRGSENAGDSIEILKDVFLKAPLAIRRFILLFDGSPSPQDRVAHVEGKRGYFRGLMKTISFSYKSSSVITGIIVYSRSYVQSGKVTVVTGGIGGKHVNVKVNLGDFVYSYKDVELVILTKASSVQSDEARQPRLNRSRSVSTILCQRNSEGSSGYRKRTSSSLPRSSRRMKSVKQSSGVESSTRAVSFVLQSTSQCTSSHLLKEPTDEVQCKRTSSSTLSELTNSSSRVSRIAAAKSRDISRSSLSARLLTSSEKTPESTGINNQASSKIQSASNDPPTKDSIPTLTGTRTRRRKGAAPVAIVDHTRLSTTDSSENETLTQNCSNSAGHHEDRSRTRRRPAINREGSSNEDDQRKASSQSIISNNGQPSRRNAVTSEPFKVAELDMMSQSQQHSGKTRSTQTQENIKPQKETSQQHRSHSSHSKKRQATASRCSPPRKSAQEEKFSTQTKSKTPEPVPAKRSHSRKK